jgi:hypothetical protein
MALLGGFSAPDREGRQNIEKAGQTLPDDLMIIDIKASSDGRQSHEWYLISGKLIDDKLRHIGC